MTAVNRSGLTGDFPANTVSFMGLTHQVGGSRFWFWVPFRQNGIKNGINLNCDWTILFHFLFHAVSRPKRKRINNYIGIFYSKGHTSTFGCKKENVWCTYRKFAKSLQTSNNATWREGRSTGTGKVCCLEVTMCFSLTIDRQGFSVVIVRGLYDVPS